MFDLQKQFISVRDYSSGIWFSLSVGKVRIPAEIYDLYLDTSDFDLTHVEKIELRIGTESVCTTDVFIKQVRNKKVFYQIKFFKDYSPPIPFYKLDKELIYVCLHFRNAKRIETDKLWSDVVFRIDSELRSLTSDISASEDAFMLYPYDDSRLLALIAYDMIFITPIKRCTRDVIAAHWNSSLNVNSRNRYLLYLEKRQAARKILRALLKRFKSPTHLHDHLWRPDGPMAVRSFDKSRTS